MAEPRWNIDYRWGVILALSFPKLYQHVPTCKNRHVVMCVTMLNKHAPSGNENLLGIHATGEMMRYLATKLLRAVQFHTCAVYRVAGTVRNYETSRPLARMLMALAVPAIVEMNPLGASI